MPSVYDWDTFFSLLLKVDLHLGCSCVHSSLKKKPSITLPFLLVLLFSISADKLSLLLLDEFYLFLALKIMTFELGPFGPCY